MRQRIPHRIFYLARLVHWRHRLDEAENDVEVHSHDVDVRAADVEVHVRDVEVLAQNVSSPTHDVGAT